MAKKVLLIGGLAHTIDTIKTLLDGKSPVGHKHKKAEITDFPTNLSQFNNDSGFQNASQVSSAISSAVGKITGFETKIVQSLPETGVKGVIYFVPSTQTGTKQAYDEYIWLDTKFEFIGSTSVDLSGYLKETDLVEITDEEIDNFFASV